MKINWFINSWNFIEVEHPKSIKINELGETQKDENDENTTDNDPGLSSPLAELLPFELYSGEYELSKANTQMADYWRTIDIFCSIFNRRDELMNLANEIKEREAIYRKLHDIKFPMR